MAKPMLLGVLAVGLVAAPVSAHDAVIQEASVSPVRGFADSLGGVRIAYRLSGSLPADVTITVSGSGHAVRTIDLPQAEPGKDLVERWDGLADGGGPVAD